MYRRHAPKCQYFGPGGRAVRTDKPFHADGIYKGQRIRLSLGTRSLQKAQRKLDAKLAVLDRLDAGEEVTIAAACERFLGSYDGVGAASTIRKYGTKLRLPSDFCTSSGVRAIGDVTVDLLERYRQSRNIAVVTWKVELQALRTFFRFCQDRGWIERNPAKQVRAPKNLKPNEIVPYTFEEEARMLGACDEIGGTKYNRA